MLKEPSELFKLSKRAQSNSSRWFGHTGKDRDPAYIALALCGEVGKLAAIIRKIEDGEIRLEDASTQFALGSQIADSFIHLLNLSGLHNIDLQVAYDQTQAKNEQKYGREKLKRDVEKVKEVADRIEIKRRAVS